MTKCNQRISNPTTALFKKVKRSSIRQIFHLFIAVFFIFCWTSCKQKDISSIEKIIVDEPFIKTEIASYNSDSITTNEYKNSIQYFSKDNSAVKVHRDSSQRIIAWFKDIDGKLVDGAEVFSTTGQICGKLNFVNGELNGEIKYYYEDGRIRSKGVFKNDYWWGEWKNYDKDGKLISVSNHADDHTVTTTPIKQ